MGLDEAQKKERTEYLAEHLTITECSQRKPYVFISYASADWKTVFQSAVVPMQRESGLRAYADKTFDKADDKWIVPMLRNVRGSDMMVAFISQSYIESYGCFLELLTAVNSKKQIVFVSLGEQLHLGDTTDLPEIEQGVKKEILNQGTTISTNTNNTSSDVMRAMKSAYTSILTLLDQDALSKYDISDAFINFFRDASINQKTINDLTAVMGTIKSVSQNVFDVSLTENSAHSKENKLKNVFPSTPPALESIPPKPQVIPQLPRGAAPQKPQAIPQPPRGAAPQKPQATPQPPRGAAPQKPQAIPQPPREAAPQKPQAAPQQPISAAFTPPPAPQQPVPASSALDNKNAGAALTAPEPPRQKSAKSKTAIIAASAAGLAVLIAVILYVRGLPETGSDAVSVEGQGAYAESEGNIPPNANTTQSVENITYKSDDGGIGTYTGQWRNDKPNGEGTMVWEDPDTWEAGTVYEGEWKDGKYHGQGTCRYVNGLVLEGDWLNGYLTYGTATSNGVTYTGNWKDGYIHGEGIMEVPGGNYYEGTWEYDELAYGYMRDRDGNEYTGEWKDGKFNGQGTYTWIEDGSTYTGEWKDNYRDGYGTMTYANGDVFEGEWENDQKNGQGTYRYHDGTVVTGIWQDNQLAE